MSTTFDSKRVLASILQTNVAQVLIILCRENECRIGIFCSGNIDAKWQNISHYLSLVRHLNDHLASPSIKKKGNHSKLMLSKGKHSL